MDQTIKKEFLSNQIGIEKLKIMQRDKMKKDDTKNTFMKFSNISVGLAAFLVAGLGGCDGSNDSLATKQQKCKNQEYKNQHQEDCEDITRRFGSTSVNNSGHSSGSSWVPMWMMMNSHNGYSYGSGTGSKSSGYVSGGSHSSSSGGSSGG
jgi:hypothetical protein